MAKEHKAVTVLPDLMTPFLVRDYISPKMKWIRPAFWCVLTGGVAFACFAVGRTRAEYSQVCELRNSLAEIRRQTAEAQERAKTGSAVQDGIVDVSQWYRGSFRPGRLLTCVTESLPSALYLDSVRWTKKDGMAQGTLDILLRGPEDKSQQFAQELGSITIPQKMGWALISGSYPRTSDSSSEPGRQVRCQFNTMP